MTTTLTTITTDIAKIFTASQIVSGTWRMEPDANGGQHARLVRVDSPTAMWLSHGGYQKDHRISIHIDWPTDPDTRERFVPYKANGTTEITVADTKSAAQIARDIERRLLPDVERLYGEQYLRLLGTRAARDHRDVTMHRFVDEVAGATYIPAPDWDRNGGHVHLGTGTVEEQGYIRTAQFNSDSVDLDLRSLPIDVAIQIAQLVNGVKS
jgi:hypothetical protein